MRTPVDAQTRNDPAKAQRATRIGHPTRWRLLNRPVIRGSSLFGRSNCAIYATARRRNQMTAPHDNFVYGARTTVLRGKFALFNGPFDEKAVTFFKGHRELSQFAIERQTVPIGLFLNISIAIPEPVGLAQAHVGYGSARP